jgi:glycosyltransferase involved in cell wall biosynthesis
MKGGFILKWLTIVKTLHGLGNGKVRYVRSSLLVSAIESLPKKMNRMPVDRIPLSPPVIQPLPAGINRPRWSVMIPVYNCATYLKETLTAVLQQALPQEEMQIEVVDDCSTDVDVAALVADMSGGRVRYFRQPHNVGSLRNFETCINRATGHLIHILHGDDLVKPGYYASIQRLFDRFPEIGAAFCRYAYVGESSKPLYLRDPEMDTAGILDNWLLRLAQRQRLQYCTVTVKREVYERLGSFYGVDYGEDWEMWMRIACHYPVAYEPEYWQLIVCIWRLFPGNRMQAPGT